MSEEIPSRDLSEDASAPARWTERPRAAPGREAPEDRAAALLRQLREPPPLSQAAVARIAARLEEARAPQRRALLPWLAPALGAAALAALAAVALRSPSSGPSSGPAPGLAAAPPRIVTVAAGAVDRIELGGGRAALRGPASAELAGQALTLRAGALAIRGGGAPLRVAVPQGVVAVRPGALVEIVVSARVGLRVAAYAGTAAIERDGAVLVEVTTGQVFEGGALSAVTAVGTEAAARLIDGVAAAPGGTAAAQPGEPAPAQPLLAEKSEEGSEAPRGSLSRGGARTSAGDPAAGLSPATAAPIPAVATPERARAAVPAERARAAVPAERAPAADAEERPAAQRSHDDAPPAPATPPESALAAESRLLASALGRLRARDGAGALTLLDEHRARFPGGALVEEAQGERVEALLLLGRRGEALAALDRSGALDRGELRVLRGELRAEAWRCAEAIGDFSAALDRGVPPALEERARYGRAGCRARGGDQEGARADLREYLQRFPGGRFSDAAREALGR